MSASLLEFRDVWEKYRIRFMRKGRAHWEEYWALQGVDLSIAAGEAVGIVGANGSGKSTLLKLAAGLLSPDRGVVTVRGKAAGLFELGAGFEPELTGRENVLATAGLFGVAKDRVGRACEEVEKFAELGKFFDAPVKCYSGGMFVRVAFSVAMQMSPDLLLIDDTLAVGDDYFQGKCLRQIGALREQGKGILFVTHDMNMLKRLCSRAVFLREGKVVEDGDSDRIAGLYSLTSGQSGAVGLLEAGDLAAVFNRGRIYLRYAGSWVTLEPGIYVHLCVDGTWYSSYQGDWSVIEAAGDVLTARGDFPFLGLTLDWTVRVSSSEGLSLDLAVESRGPGAVEEAQVLVTVRDSYVRWFALSRRGEFPAHGERDKEWTPVFSSLEHVPEVGLAPAREEGPALLVMQEGASGANIFNSEYLTGGRIVQFRMLGGASRFRGRIRPVGDMEAHFQALREDLEFSHGRSLVRWEGGGFQLSYDGLTLSAPYHMTTRYLHEGVWAASYGRNWHVEKREGMFVARCVWPGLGVEEEWRIIPQQSHSFLWEVWLNLARPVRLEESHASSLFSSRYYAWSDGTLRGVFPAEPQVCAADVAVRCFQQRHVGLESREGGFVPVSLCVTGETGAFIKVFNGNMHTPGRELVQVKVDAAPLPAGRRCCFRALMSLGSECPVSFAPAYARMASGECVVEFSAGKIRIFWRGEEITHGLGGYASLRYRGDCFDSSSSAQWEVVRANEESFEVVGRWDPLPVSQHWRVRFVPGGTAQACAVGLEVSTESSREVLFEQVQWNVMLSEKYTRWKMGRGEGTFPGFKPNLPESWEVLGSLRGIPGEVLAQAPEGGLAKVAYKVEESFPEGELQAVNSDLFHRGRMLQLSWKEQVLRPGEGSLRFRGRIVVGEE